MIALTSKFLYNGELGKSKKIYFENLMPNIFSDMLCNETAHLRDKGIRFWHCNKFLKYLVNIHWFMIEICWLIEFRMKLNVDHSSLKFWFICCGDRGQRLSHANSNCLLHQLKVIRVS